MSSPVFEGGTPKRGGLRQGSEVVSVRLLGDFRVSVGRRAIEESAWRLRKAAAVVKLLALAPGHRLHRERIVDLLWPALDLKAGSNNLRRTLHAARGILDPSRKRATAEYLVSRGGHVALRPDGNLRVDVDAFEELAGYARRSREPATYEAALDLYAGDLLPGDPYEVWAEGRRRELRETRLSLLSGLASAHEERGDHGLAAGALRTLTREDPINEEAHARLMRLHALSGHKAEALRQYGLLREGLSQQLGTEPSASTRALAEEISTGRFDPEAMPSSPASARGEANAPRDGLPKPRTSFVDREHELVELKQALNSARLLTLTGTGGSGKTRLALRTAADLAGAYPAGVWFAGLAGLLEPELVPKSVAGDLGFREEPGRSPLETLADSLGEKKILLVLDNCEHLLDAAACLVDHLLDRCPRLQVLTTSREPLGVEGEVLFPVVPLPVPNENRTNLSELARNPAVRLFVERARQKLLQFSPSEGDARAVGLVCRRLGGIPLAIELAAGWVGTLATEQLVERLGDSLGLLSTGPRTASPRHRTMRATFDWSFELLSGHERTLFRRLSVFAGGFTLEAAEAACSDEGSIGRGEVLNLLSGLVDKSLVVADIIGEVRVRYRMLEPVGQYARERLEASGEEEVVRRRHAAHFLALAERAEPELKGRGQVEWLQRLEEDNGNLRAAMAWLLAEGEIEDAVRMAWSLWIFWLIHGHQSEGRRWIEAALEKGENLVTHTRARALAVQASTYYGLGSPERMEQILEEASALFRQVADDPGLATALGGMAGARMHRGDAEGAIALFEEAIPLGREAGEKWGPSGALAHLGSIYLGLGDFERAARSFEEGLALSRDIGNRLGEATALYGLATAEQGRGGHDRAAELYAEGLVSAAEADDKANISYCLEGLAQAAMAQGKTERAAWLFGAAVASLEAAGGSLYPYAQDRSLYERAVGEVRSRLGEAAFSEAWALGSATSPAEAVEYALSGEQSVASGKTALPGGDIALGQSVGLTRREEEVAILVARGLTNRQIASELSVSEHTAANHVAKILRKLGLRSRAQVAAWMASPGAPD